MSESKKQEGDLTLGEVGKELDARIIIGEEFLDHDFQGVCGADLMSDVLAFATPGGILLTGLRNVQSVITAHVAEVKAIVYVRGKQPDEEAVKLAGQKRIPLLTTPLSMFEACGRLYSKGLESSTRIERNE